MTEQGITTVEELPAELRAELVAKRQAGTTLAELKKAYPQVAPDVIRSVLPPLPKPKPEPQAPRTRRARATKPTQTPTTAQAKPKASASAKAPAKQPAGKTKTERKAIDPKVAAKAVNMRAKLDGKGRPTSWAKIGYALKLPEGAPKSQAGDAARRAYRQIKGENAPTGPSDY
jgi:hypothetical protein